MTRVRGSDQARSLPRFWPAGPGLAAGRTLTCPTDCRPGDTTTAPNSGEILKLEDAVRYPGAWRTSALITVAGVVLMFAGSLTTPGISVWLWVVAGMALMLGATALVIRRANRLMAAAKRIFEAHPDCTPQQAANAARKELGLAEIRYP